MPGETVTIAGDTVTITVPGEPVTVTVEAEPTTVTVEAEPVTVTVEAEPTTVTVEAEPVTVTVEAEPTTVTVEAEPVTVTVEAEPTTVTVEAEPTTVTVQADPKTNPTFSLGEWAGSNNTYSAVVSYNGDGVLTANTGTLSGSTITVSDEDGNFNGVISAAEGTNFAPANLAFTHSKETVSGGGSDSLIPQFTITGWNADTNLVSYEGDYEPEYIAIYFSDGSRIWDENNSPYLMQTVAYNAEQGIFIEGIVGWIPENVYSSANQVAVVSQWGTMPTY